jgi:preprotein translocase SecF subunit
MASFRFRIVKDKTEFNFMGLHRYTFALSALMAVMVIFLLFTRGLNLGIDFTGGVLMEIKPPAEMKVEDIRKSLDGLTHGTPTIQEFGADAVLIKLPGKEVDTEGQKALREEVQKRLTGAEMRRVEYVGPNVGGELIHAGVTAFIYSMIGILAYIWLRFEWQFGVVAVFALAHDMFATLLFFLITQIEFDLATVAAALLVAGYSINETVIIFDRVRETLRKYRKMPMKDVINYSINSTLPRTIMTSGSTLLALLALWLFGGLVIRSFVSALFLGILIGTHSSYFVSTPSLYYLKLRHTAEDDNA